MGGLFYLLVFFQQYWWLDYAVLPSYGQLSTAVILVRVVIFSLWALGFNSVCQLHTRYMRILITLGPNPEKKVKREVDHAVSKTWV
jgi:hypothetical protein